MGFELDFQSYLSDQLLATVGFVKSSITGAAAQSGEAALSVPQQSDRPKRRR